MTAYEAGRWYALNGRACPCGATPECRRGYADAEMEIIDRGVMYAADEED